MKPLKGDEHFARPTESNKQAAVNNGIIHNLSSLVRNSKFENSDSKNRNINTNLLSKNKIKQKDLRSYADRNIVKQMQLGSISVEDGKKEFKQWNQDKAVDP